MAKHPNYEVLEELGRGENTIVHRAWDLTLKRDVAIKELTSEPGSDGGKSEAQRVNQFLSEASFLTQFQHEHVLRIHSVDTDRGWIVMELMKGSLATQITAKPMDADQVRSVLRQMLKALDFLHQKEKVHGAVRPSNILINDEGVVKLSDFEASGRDGERRVPNGSKKYLAPELIRSEFGPFGPAVDLYCLGFTALELLLGPKFDSLFPGTGEGAIDADVAWLRWHSSDESMKPAREIDGQIPSDLARVIDALLKKPVTDRPQDAAAVLKLLNDEPLVPVPVIEPVVTTGHKADLNAILPSKAVKLRQISPKNNGKRTQRSATPARSKGRLNETLNKPYVLWPICMGILAVAFSIGMVLRGDTSNQGQPIADHRKPINKEIEQPPVEKPLPDNQDRPDEPTQGPLPVELRVTPDTDQATLIVGGEPRTFRDLDLQPGAHEILIRKEGFEDYRSTLEVSPDKTLFEIVLNERTEDVEMQPPLDPTEPTEDKPGPPTLIDVRVTVEPVDAELTIDGQPATIVDGMLQWNPEAAAQLTLAAEAEGYQPKSITWTLNEMEADGFDLHLALTKIPTPQPETTVALPTALIAKPGAAIDEQTGLPERVFVRALENAAPMEMALVKAGAYRFGVSDDQPRTWERPAEAITLEQPFYIGLHEVTNAQYLAFNSQPADSDAVRDNQPAHPITNLSVREAAEFCDWAGGRLPSEHQWEAAIRGLEDQGYPLPWGDGNLAPDRCKLFRGESGDDHAPLAVDALPHSGNDIGLLNTIGNVSEWCDDQHNARQFIVKGCSYRIPPGDHVRVTWRHPADWKGANDIGLRLLVPVAASPKPSAALTFIPPTNLDSLLVSLNPDHQEPQRNTPIETKTVAEIANEFTGPAELVIDSGGFIDEIRDIAFSPDGQQVAVAGGKVVRIWDVATGERLHTLRGDRSRTSYGNVNAVTWSPDGEYLLVGVSDYREHGNVRVYRTNNLDEIDAVLTGHAAPCRKLCFSRDGQLLASADADGLIVIREWPSQTIKHRVAARNRDNPVFDSLHFPTSGPYLLGVDFAGPQVLAAESGARLGSSDEMPLRVRGWLVDVYNKLIGLPFAGQANRVC